MASSKRKVIAVDEKFFQNIFEIKRIELQKQLGIINLSQQNFSKMILGFKMRSPKIKSKIKNRGKINVFF